MNKYFGTVKQSLFTDFLFHIIILKHIYISLTEEIIEEKIIKKVLNLAP